MVETSANSTSVSVAELTTTDAILKEAFLLFDRDADGKLNMKELIEVLRSLGLNPSQSEVDSMLETISMQQQSGTQDEPSVTFRDFVALLKKQRCLDGARELREAFTVLDVNGSGSIDTTELRHILTNLGDKLSDAEVDELIREIDPSGQGFVTFDTFVSVLWGDRDLLDR